MRRSCFAAVLVVVALVPVACVPADEAPALGSFAFAIATDEIGRGDSSAFTQDGYLVTVERVVLSFKTMTIGQIGDEDKCSYRGRGAASNIVFGPESGILQTFNGIRPTTCPDVGIVFGPPDPETSLGPGATSDDLLALAGPLPPAHALVELSARPAYSFGSDDQGAYRIVLRFDTERTSSRFGGCSDDEERGIVVRESARGHQSVTFSPSTLLQESLGPSASLRLAPFILADTDDDKDVTMAELDALRLGRVQAVSNFYQLPNGITSGSFGDFVRALFRFTIRFGTFGVCNGNEPGTE